MSSLGMGSSDSWRYYKQELDAAQHLEEINQEELSKKDPLYALRKKKTSLCIFDRSALNA